MGEAEDQQKEGGVKLEVVKDNEKDKVTPMEATNTEDLILVDV